MLSKCCGGGHVDSPSQDRLLRQRRLRAPALGTVGPLTDYLHAAQHLELFDEEQELATARGAPRQGVGQCLDGGERRAEVVRDAREESSDEDVPASPMTSGSITDDRLWLLPRGRGAPARAQVRPRGHAPRSAHPHAHLLPSPRATRTSSHRHARVPAAAREAAHERRRRERRPRRPPRLSAPPGAQSPGLPRSSEPRLTAEPGA